MSAEIELLKLAKERYTNLSPAEEKFFRAVAKGEPADFSGASDEENDPSHADKWPAERALNADRLAWLCTNSAASKLVTHRGILVLGAQVNGILNLEWTDITFPLNMRNCAFSGSILLNQANLSSLDLFGTHIKDLRADGAKFEGTVFLRNVKTEGEVRFMRTTFAADLDFSGGQFINAKATAINADGVRIEGVAFLRNVKTEG